MSTLNAYTSIFAGCIDAAANAAGRLQQACVGGADGEAGGEAGGEGREAGLRPAGADGDAEIAFGVEAAASAEGRRGDGAQGAAEQPTEAVCGGEETGTAGAEGHTSIWAAAAGEAAAGVA